MDAIIAGVLIAAGVLVAFGILAAITDVYERLPSSPPLYDYDDEVLPDPEWRARVPRTDPEREWVIER